METKLGDKESLLVFRLRLLLKPRKQVRVPVQQAAMYYAMLCEADGIANGETPAMPDGVLLTAPDSGTRSANPDQPLAMGLTLLSDSQWQAGRLAQGLIDGLRKMGRQPTKNQAMGHFSFENLEDLIANETVSNTGSLTPISTSHLQQEIEQLQARKQITLVFESPLRTQRPKSARRDNHKYFDDEYFSIDVLANRLLGRLAGLGIRLPDKTSQSHPFQHAATLSENDLVWVDVGYGKGRRKTLGGSVGTVILTEPAPELLPLLVWGQYVRIGENTRFGFGDFRIEELGPDPFRVRRGCSFADIAFSGAQVDRAAEEAQLPAGSLRHAIADIVRGVYEPQPYKHLEIEKSSGGTRKLSIPSPRDKVLQRLLLDEIAPGIDGFLNNSAIAFRKGLGRDQSAREIRRAFKKGYQWAVQADFESFFDNVDHDLLQRRMHAFLSDHETENLIMQWMRAGAPSQTRGLPTGSPLSPVLSNLFLDQFDDAIVEQGGKLVRYCDDFLILCRTEQQAHDWFELAREQADKLLLKLNSEKTQFIDLDKPFVFLGFRFERFEEWQFDGGQQPQLIEDIGWEQAKPKSDQPTLPTNMLPGESQWDSEATLATVIVGPEVIEVMHTKRQLVFSSTGKKSSRSIPRIPIDHVEQLVIVGTATVSWRTQLKLAGQGVPISVCHESGFVQMEVLPEPLLESATAIAGQLACSSDPVRCLEIARQLVAAKLLNHSALAAKYHRYPRDLPSKLDHLARKALQAESLPSLLGIEGSGAAIWFGRFSDMLSHGFSFERRVSPDAADPVNALMNLGHTTLYRLIRLLIRNAGLINSMGVFHQQRAGHAALASDFQEPLRHVIDRAVIEATSVLRTSDFRSDPDGPYPLKIQPHAIKKFMEIVHILLAQPVAGHHQNSPLAYRRQANRMIRSFKLHCLEPDRPFRVFVHPGYWTDKIM